MIRDKPDTDNLAEEIRVLKTISRVSARLARNLSDLAKKTNLERRKNICRK